MVIFYLTCADKSEADAISTALLQARLVACSRASTVNSTYWWDGKIQNNDETLLMMESVEEKFADVEKVVAELHSYDEFVLTMVPVTKTTPGVEAWLAENIR